MIPFSDINAQHKQLKLKINKAIKAVIERGDFILGKDLKYFEEEFASFCGTKYALGVSSGTSALFLALASLDLNSSDEVIVPNFTFIATALAVSYTKAKPVFVDIDEKTYNIDPGLIEKTITKNTKAIIPVHLYGQPALMEKINAIAKKHNLIVIEDAAQAHGAEVNFSDKVLKAGNLSDIGCFSFYPTKNLGCMGDGGMITTNSDSIYQKLLKLRDYGRVSKYEHALIGYNSRLDTIQAAILREKLKMLDKWNEMRKLAAINYDNELSKIKGIITPFIAKGRKSVYHVYAIRCKERDRVFNGLIEKGISAIIHYPIPISLQKAYVDLGYKKGDFPVSEKVASEIISLPMYPHLDKNKIKFIASVLKELIGSHEIRSSL